MVNDSDDAISVDMAVCHDIDGSGPTKIECNDSTKGIVLIPKQSFVTYHSQEKSAYPNYLYPINITIHTMSGDIEKNFPLLIDSVSRCEYTGQMNRVIAFSVAKGQQDKNNFVATCVVKGAV